MCDLYLVVVVGFDVVNDVILVFIEEFFLVKLVVECEEVLLFLNNGFSIFLLLFECDYIGGIYIDKLVFLLWLILMRGI